LAALSGRNLGKSYSVIKPKKNLSGPICSSLLFSTYSFTLSHFLPF